MSDYRITRLRELVSSYNAAIKSANNHARQADEDCTRSDVYAQYIDNSHPTDEECEAIGWLR